MSNTSLFLSLFTQALRSPNPSSTAQPTPLMPRSPMRSRHWPSTFESNASRTKTAFSSITRRMIVETETTFHWLSRIVMWSSGSTVGPVSRREWGTGNPWYVWRMGKLCLNMGLYQRKRTRCGGRKETSNVIVKTLGFFSNKQNDRDKNSST